MRLLHLRVHLCKGTSIAGAASPHAAPHAAPLADSASPAAPPPLPPVALWTYGWPDALLLLYTATPSFMREGNPTEPEGFIYVTVANNETCKAIAKEFIRLIDQEHIHDT